MLAYYDRPRAAITVDLVDYFLNLDEEELKPDDSSDDLSALHDSASYSGDPDSDVEVEDIEVIVSDSDMEIAKRLVDAFCQLFDSK
jgi:hypothetical protein